MNPVLMQTQLHISLRVVSEGRWGGGDDQATVGPAVVGFVQVVRWRKCRRFSGMFLASAIQPIPRCTAVLRRPWSSPKPRESALVQLHEDPRWIQHHRTARWCQWQSKKNLMKISSPTTAGQGNLQYISHNLCHDSHCHRHGDWSVIFLSVLWISKP
jgi:hypothetical protein